MNLMVYQVLKAHKNQTPKQPIPKQLQPESQSPKPEFPNELSKTEFLIPRQLKDGCGRDAPWSL